MIMTEPTQRELRNVTRLALQRLADDRHADADIRYRALAARAQLDGRGKPDLRGPSVSRARIQPGLWLTVDASRNIMLEVRTTDEAELLAAYALSDTATLAAQLELARTTRDALDEKADVIRRAGLADKMAIREGTASDWPGEDAASRRQAAETLLAAGLSPRSVRYVLRRAYGHLSATFNVNGTDQLGTVTYGREHGTYAVRVPATEQAGE